MTCFEISPCLEIYVFSCACGTGAGCLKITLIGLQAALLNPIWEFGIWKVHRSDLAMSLVWKKANMSPSICFTMRSEVFMKVPHDGTQEAVREGTVRKAGTRSVLMPVRSRTPHPGSIFPTSSRVALKLLTHGLGKCFLNLEFSTISQSDSLVANSDRQIASKTPENRLLWVTEARIWLLLRAC